MNETALSLILLKFMYFDLDFSVHGSVKTVCLGPKHGTQFIFYYLHSTYFRSVVMRTHSFSTWKRDWNVCNDKMKRVRTSSTSFIVTSRKLLMKGKMIVLLIFIYPRDLIHPVLNIKIPTWIDILISSSTIVFKRTLRYFSLIYSIL